MRWSTSSCAALRPLPAASLWNPVRRLRYAVPQWERGLARAEAAKRRLPHAHVDGIECTGRPAKPSRPVRRPRSSACSRRSIPLSGIAGASRFSGAGRAGSKPTRPVKKRERGYYALPAALARSRRRLGQRHGQGRRADVGLRLAVSGRRPRDRRVPPGARLRRWRSCAPFSTSDRRHRETETAASRGDRRPPRPALVPRRDPAGPDGAGRRAVHRAGRLHGVPDRFQPAGPFALRCGVRTPRRGAAAQRAEGPKKPR